jgi:hypothetical protein
VSYRIYGSAACLACLTGPIGNIRTYRETAGGGFWGMNYSVDGRQKAILVLKKKPMWGKKWCTRFFWVKGLREKL